MERRTLFAGWKLPLLLVAPQLALTFVFFYWPAAVGAYESFTRTDAFGVHTVFVGFANFITLFEDPRYIQSIIRTIEFCVAVTVLAIVLGLVLAVAVDRELRGRNIYQVLMIWPYAVAPAVSAVLWILLLNPQIGPVGRFLVAHGINWDYALDGNQAMLMVILASAWKQVSYNFIFVLAGLQSIPKAVIEAARMDGATGWYRFRTVILPLLMPTVFFLIVVDLVYAAFDTFGTIWAMTRGGPASATETLVIKVYNDGVVNLDLGSSSAQSVVLMLGIVALTALQFRFLGRRADS